MINLLVVCEKKQELDDLEKVVVELRNKNKHIFVCLVSLESLTGEKLTPTPELFDQTITPSSLFNQAYYRLGLVKKIISILYGIRLLVFFSRQYNITHILYGVPIVFFRALNFIPLRKYKTFSYVRSTVMMDDSHRKKRSRFVRKSLNAISFTKPYVADYFFCIDGSTKKYIQRLYPDCDANKIQNIGSIYSYNLLMSRERGLNKKQENNQKITKVCFLSSAFSWHGDSQSDNEQVSLLDAFCEKVRQFNLNTSSNLQVLLKLHPRDNIELYSHLIEQKKVEILHEINVKVLDDSYCFVSVLSTLSYELAQAGFKSLYICNKSLKSKYLEWYQKNSIIPLDVCDESLMKNISSFKAVKPVLFMEKKSPQKKLASFIESLVK